MTSNPWTATGPYPAHHVLQASSCASERQLSGLTILKNADLYAPGHLGSNDVLIAGERIVSIAPQIDSPTPGTEVVDLGGARVVPGLVDGHLHQIGGCGLEGYASRAPEIWAGEIAAAGITTSVATPGIENLTKNMDAVLAKAHALETDGLSTYAFIGGFRKPFMSVTGSVRRDLYLIEKIIGIKIALGDAVASRFTEFELIELAAELEWACQATGKACIMHTHLGSLDDPAGQLLDTIRHSNAAPERFQATHGNNTRATLAASVELAKAGCVVDLNPLLDPERGYRKSIGVRDAVPFLLDANVELSMLTMSTDANASVPWKRPDGTRGPYLKYLESLWQGVIELVERAGLPFEDVLPLVTANPARVLRLRQKGRIEVDMDADLLVLDAQSRISDVYSRGALVVQSTRPLIRSMYESEGAVADRTTRTPSGSR
jgi:beta-aspartyl-dipeptidase (metallo-type)